MSHKVVEATVDGIRFLYDGGEIEVDYNASDGDVVRLTIEPLEVKVTDGFRAAVKKACNCDSSSGGGSGGSTGGGVLVVHEDENGTLDKTWQEIHDAMLAGGAVLKSTQPDRVEAVTLATYNSMADKYVVMGLDDAVVYATSTASGYPTLSE